MNELDTLRDKVDQLQGSLLAMECFLNALSEALPESSRPLVSALFASESQAFRVALLRSTAPEATVDAFERDTQRAIHLLGEPPFGVQPAPAPLADPLDD